MNGGVDCQHVEAVSDPKGWETLGHLAGWEGASQLDLGQVAPRPGPG